MSQSSDMGIWRVVSVTAIIIPLGVFTIAVLGGQGLFLNAAAFALHAALGHMLTLLALLMATFLWLLRAYRYAVIATLQAVLLVTQTGLGYAGRRLDIAVASSLHIPVGVATFGVGLLLASWLKQYRRNARISACDLSA